jgi:hypothetical protein
VKDVAVTAILAPLDTLDSGLVVHPRASVWNYGNQTQTFPLEFRIGSWVSRATVVNLIPGGQQEITAPDPYYTVPGMYLHQVTAIVPGDLHSENNVLRDTFWARGTVTCDLEIVISAPCGAYDTLDTIIPHATICGFVLHPETCGVWFTIENPDDSVVYRESLTVVVVHLPLDVEFPPTVLRDIGRHLAACSLYCVHNQNHLNNVMREYFYIFARLRGDMGIVWVSLPRDTIDTLATQSMAVGVRNFASECDSGALFLMFRDVTRDSLVYSADTAFGLAGGAAITVMFPLHRFQTLGPHDGLCSLWAYNADTSNALRWRFWVVPRLGVTEGSVPASSRPPPATLIRGVLFLGAGRRGQSTTGQSLVFLLDAAGREVMALKPGPNDVRHLPAGVYFICRAEIPGDSPQRDIPRISVGVAMAKVVIQH